MTSNATVTSPSRQISKRTTITFEICILHGYQYASYFFSTLPMVPDLGHLITDPLPLSLSPVSADREPRSGKRLFVRQFLLVWIVDKLVAEAIRRCGSADLLVISLIPDKASSCIAEIRLAKGRWPEVRLLGKKKELEAAWEYAVLLF